MNHADALRPGDTIGLCAPCWLAEEAWAQNVRAALGAMGFRVKFARNLFARGWGYAASPEERSADINELILDDEVKLIFFGGGEGAEDVVPLIDYEAAARHPKRWLSYSDGTSILHEVWRRTGLTTLYGQSPGFIPGISSYNKEQFICHVTGSPASHIPASTWQALVPGMAEGTLIGGYLGNFLFTAAMSRIPPNQKYILFLEDNERFQGVEGVSALLGRLEQCGVMQQTVGLLFGHYSVVCSEQLMQRLARLGEKWNIPTAYCDDFGHGIYHAVLPIGAQARLDASAGTLTWK